jgi:hypothetical protein
MTAGSHGHFLGGVDCLGPGVRVLAGEAGRAGQQVSDRYREMPRRCDGFHDCGIIIAELAGLAHVPCDPVLILTVIGELLLLSFIRTAFGVMMAALITRIPAFTALTQMLVMPLFFRSGALCRPARCPPWLAVVPGSTRSPHAVYPVRHAVFSHPNISPAANAALSPALTWAGDAVPWPCRSASSR